MVTISTDRPIASQNLPIPLGFNPEGIEEGLFDENTLYLIKSALPETYYHVFLHLLYHATTDPRSTMQPSLFAQTGEGQNEAIILYRSVAELSKSPRSPAGPETYHKAILIFEALGVIHRTFHRGFTEVRMPLGKREILIPSLLRSLRELLGDEKRKGYRNVKVQQLARKVAKRLKSGEFLAGIPRPATSSAGLELRDLLTHLLREHGVTEAQVQQTALAQTCTLISQAMLAAKNGRVLAEVGESVRDATLRAWARPEDFQSHLGDSFTQEEAESQDEAVAGTGQEGEFLGEESPSSRCSARKSRGRRLKKGELDAIFGKVSPENEGTLLAAANSGDSLPAVSIIASSSQVITRNGEKTLIDAGQQTPAYVDPRPHREIEREALEYRNRFDKGRGRQWPGSLYNTVRSTPPEIRHLAAIATHYYMVFRLPNGEVVKRPGGWFTGTCKLYRQPGAEIPQDIRAWAETGLSLSEIEIRLRQGIRHPAQLQLPFGGSGVSLDQQATTQDGEVPGQSYELPAAPAPTYDWMNQDEANDLRARIERERGHYPILVDVEPGEENGVFVVVTTWNGAEVIHHSAGEWATYFADVKACL
jgi:hypothetical protein